MHADKLLLMLAGKVLLMHAGKTPQPLYLYK